MDFFMSILLAIFPTLNRGRRGDARSPTQRNPLSTACEDHAPSLLVPLATDNRSDNSGPGPLSQARQSLRSHSYERGQESEVPSPDSRPLSERDLTTLRVMEYLENLATAPIIKPPSLSLSQHGSLPPSPSVSNQPLLQENLLSPPIPILQENSAIQFEDGPDLTQKGVNPGPEITPPFPPVELGLSWDKSDAFSRSDMLPTHPLDSNAPAPLPIRSAVSNSISSPTLLTTELSTIGDGVRTTYMGICEKHWHLTRRPIPFSSLSPEQLEVHFAAAVDAKNALRLRKSVVAIDISDSLEQLLPKLTMYEEDGRIVEAAFEDIDLIKEECRRRKLSPNFYALENLREILPSHTLSVMERHRELFSSMQHVLEHRAGAQRTAAQFLKDPLALKERRLSHWTCQR